MYFSMVANITVSILLPFIRSVKYYLKELLLEILGIKINQNSPIYSPEIYKFYIIFNYFFNKKSMTICMNSMKI